MRDLPSRGRCHAAFLLAYSARVRRCDDFDAWIRAAADKPTHMAASLDLLGTARLLLDMGLASVRNTVLISGELARLDRIADFTTLKAIANLFFVRRPPNWLRTAVRDGQLIKEFIPGPDLDTISWIGTDLEAVLVAAYFRVYGAADEALLKSLGNAGELAVLSALQAKGIRPRHVALISDRYGYDIEIDFGSQYLGIEVKAAVTSTAARIFVSRNEFNVAQRMGSRWKIIQVTFSSNIVARGIAMPADVEEIRELSSASLCALAPIEEAGFRWIESAEFRPASSLWTSSELSVADDFAFSFR